MYEVFVVNILRLYFGSNDYNTPKRKKYTNTKSDIAVENKNRRPKVRQTDWQKINKT